MGQRRVLFLGGAYSQIPIIKEAKSRGWYIITCDYLPDNPGHVFADEYYNISTTDFEGVFDLAKKIQPDYVIAYASDPAAPIAANVSEKLGLPGNSYQSTRILAEKDLFRTFLTENGFNAPIATSINISENTLEKINLLQFPIIVKPTDSSGSKGVSKVTFIDEVNFAVDYAFLFSRNKRIIAEEFIDNELADIHGDGFVIDGELVFSCLGDHIYNNKTNPFNPIGTLWPTKQSDDIVKKINDDVNRIVKLSGFRNGPINIEARVSMDRNHYIMEIGPRSGGHFVPQAIQYATGFDMVKASLDVLCGQNISIPEKKIHPVAYYAIHSDISGILKKISISQQLKPFIKEFYQYIQLGEKVEKFQGSNAAIGILLLSFSFYEDMIYYTTLMDRYIVLTIGNSFGFKKYDNIY